VTSHVRLAAARRAAGLPRGVTGRHREGAPHARYRHTCVAEAARRSPRVMQIANFEAVSKI